MPHNLPSIDLGTGGPPSAIIKPGDIVDKIEEEKEIEEQEKEESEDRNPHTTKPLETGVFGRYNNFGSLFKKDVWASHKGLVKGSARKFYESKYGRNTFTSFSGADTKMSISFKGGDPVFVGEAQTVTYSLFRPIQPVYNLGSEKPSGFVRGPRTVAGSVIFTVFDRNVLLNAFYNAYAKHGDSDCVDREYSVDELPPFDIHLTFMNEYGISSALAILGVYVTSEGQVHSVEDMITENTMQYVAQDIVLMRPGDIY